MYDLELKSGTDLGDVLTGDVLTENNTRLGQLEWLLDKICAVPSEWVSNIDRSKPRNRLVGVTCTEYSDLVIAWRKALKWRQTMDDVLSVMLAVSASTEQVGDQLFLQVIGDAGSGKTRFCDGMLVSSRCYPLEHLTGFHSGWKDGSGEDYSLIARINRKTMITPEGDVLMSSPKFQEIMSQQRRIFDGTSGASFKNMKEDRRYTGLRTPWIMAGTPALLDTNQSKLGDRFLKVFIDPPSEDEKTAILKRVGFSALESVRTFSDGKPESQLEPRICKAYQLTGGYIDWLRNNSNRLLNAIDFSDEALEICENLARFTAFMRAEPSYKTEDNPTTEVPTRLHHQYVRLACCLTVVLNKKAVDAEVLRRVRKVAMDTSRGKTYEMCSRLSQVGNRGIEVRGLGLQIGRGPEQTLRMLRFLRAVGVARSFRVKMDKLTTKPRWKLHPVVQKLWKAIMEVKD